MESSCHMLPGNHMYALIVIIEAYNTGCIWQLDLSSVQSISCLLDLGLLNIDLTLSQRCALSIPSNPYLNFLPFKWILWPFEFNLMLAKLSGKQPVEKRLKYTHLQLDGRILRFVGWAITNYLNTKDKLHSKLNPLGAHVYKRVGNNTLISSMVWWYWWGFTW